VNDATFRGRAVYLPATGTLVAADLHIGRDEASGVEFPLGERADLDERLAALVARYDPAEVVLAGDILHSFAGGSRRADRGLRNLLDGVRDAGATPVMVAGNHDGGLREVWDGAVHDAYRLADGTVVCHGHEPPEASGDRYVVGHDHPAIAIEGDRRPCFLWAPDSYRGGDLLMLPAFTRLAAGVEVNGMGTDDFRSPLVTDADALRPIVRDPDGGETLRFPPLGEFRRLL